MAIDLRTELLLNGLWTDITAYTGYSQGLSITRGVADETPLTQPATLGLQLKNMDGRFSQRNPLGPYYPNLVRNTQVRVSLPEGASYLRADVDQASYAYCNDSAGISVTGDTEIQLDVTLANWRSQQALAGKWFGPMGQRSWRLVLGENGTLTFRWSTDGVTTSSAQSTVPVPVPPLRRQAIRVTLAAASGTVTFYTAAAAVNQAPLGSILNSSPAWTQLGGTVVSGTTSVFDGTGGLYVSGFNQIGWMSDAANIHSCFGVDSVTTKAFFDTPDSFASGGDPTTDPRQDGITATPLLSYTTYTQFLADVTGVAQTIGANTYNPRAINAVFKWVRYDVEGGSTWTTDPTEKADPRTYILNFISTAHSHGFNCMITPGRDLGNTDTVHPKNAGETLDAWYVRVNVASWCSGADVFEVQDQANQVIPGEFAGFFAAVQAQAKAANANLPVWCGLSTTYGNGLNMYTSALLAPLADGFWINIIGDTADSLDFMRRWLAAPMVPQIPQMSGKTHALKLLSGIGGTVKASPDFTAATAGATTVTDAQGNIFKLWGTTEISNRKYRFHGEVAAWPQTWDPSGRAVWVNVTANGLLRRLSQRDKPFTTPMRRYWTRQAGAYVPVAYWPCEESGGQQFFASGLPGGPQMTFGNGKPTLAADSVFPGSLPIPKANGGTAWTGRVPSYTSSGNTAVRFLVDPDPGLASLSNVILATIDCMGTAEPIQVNYGPSGSTAAVGIQNIGLFAVNLPAIGPFILSVELDEGGSSTNVTLKAVMLGSTTVLSSGTTNIGQTVGQITRITMFPVPDPAVSVSPGNTAAGHVAIQTIIPDIGGLAGPQNGWAGEAAGTRFSRLCSEEGITFSGQGQLSVSSPMGAQAQDTLVSLLQSCASTDQGLMTEPRHQLALGYRTRYSLSNQSPAITLNYAAANVSDMQPTDDDQYTVNNVTVSRQGGSSSQLVLTSGALSIQAPPNGVGTYDTAVTLSLYSDTQTLDEAGWLLHLGTVDEPRYPGLALNLRRTALAGIYYDLQDISLGDRYIVVNTPLWLPPDGISQIIHQQAEQLSSTVFTMQWTGVPESSYQTMIFDDLVVGRADTDGTTLGSTATTTQTQLNALTGTRADGFQFPLWTTAQADFPFDIVIAGERMTVLDINGAPANFLVSDDASFNASLGNWVTAGNSTIARVTSPVQAGSGAAQITSVAAGDAVIASCNASNILTQGLACAAGDTIALSAWFRAATTPRTCAVGANFYDNTGTPLVSGGSLLAPNTITDSTAAYTKLAGTVTAPASAAFCRLHVRAQATGAAGEVHYADTPYIADVTTGTTNRQSMVVARSVNGIVKSHVTGEDMRLFTPPTLAM